MASRRVLLWLYATTLFQSIVLFLVFGARCDYALFQSNLSTALFFLLSPEFWDLNYLYLGLGVWTTACWALSLWLFLRNLHRSSRSSRHKWLWGLGLFTAWLPVAPFYLRSLRRV